MQYCNLTTLLNTRFSSTSLFLNQMYFLMEMHCILLYNIFSNCSASPFPIGVSYYQAGENSRVYGMTAKVVPGYLWAYSRCRFSPQLFLRVQPIYFIELKRLCWCLKGNFYQWWTVFTLCSKYSLERYMTRWSLGSSPQKLHIWL